jgi:hypothetical protein
MSIAPLSVVAASHQMAILNKPVEMDIHQEQSRVNAEYHPAELTIHTKNPDIQIDWRPVLDSLDLKTPTGFLKERAIKTTQQFYDDIAQTARDGDRRANIASGEKNVEGKIAQERYMRSIQVETNVGLMPERGPIMKVTTYPPEIHVETKRPTVHPNDIRPKVTFKQGSFVIKSTIDFSV